MGDIVIQCLLYLCLIGFGYCSFMLLVRSGVLGWKMRYVFGNNNTYSSVWDARVNSVLDDYRTIRLDTYHIVVKDQKESVTKIWIENFPYAYCDNPSGTGRASLKTAIRVRELEEFLASNGNILEAKNG